MCNSDSKQVNSVPPVGGQPLSSLKILEHDQAMAMKRKAEFERQRQGPAPRGRAIPPLALPRREESDFEGPQGSAKLLQERHDQPARVLAADEAGGPSVAADEAGGPSLSRVVSRDAPSSLLEVHGNYRHYMSSLQ